MNLNDQQLVAAAFEGALDESGFRQLQERLRAEPALLAIYREHALLHHSLCEEFEGRQMIGESGPSPVARSPRWVPVLAVCAAVVALVFAGWKMLRSPGSPPVVAGYFLSGDAVAAVDGRAVTDESSFAPGSRLEVERGWVRLSLPGDAVAVIEAPASVVYEADQVLRLESGRGRFRCPEGARGMTIKTASLSAVDLGTDFGVLSRPGGTDELHVFEGEVELHAAVGEAAAVLRAKEAASIGGDGAMVRMVAREKDFSSLTPEIRVLAEDRFDTGTEFAGRRQAAGDEAWRVTRGSPNLVDGHLEGTDFEAYLSLPEVGLSAVHPVLLATMETVAANGPPFHTPGWAGLSFFQEGYEICFFGDSFGPEETWSVDVRRRIVPVLPARYLTGPRTMTLRYDRRDGTVELHEGESPGDQPLVRSKLLPGLEVDEIRLGASQGATLAVTRLKVRAVHEPLRR